MIRRPFSHAEEVAVVLPPGAGPGGEPSDEQVAALEALLTRESYELEVELGAPVRITRSDPGGGPRLLLGPAAASRALRGSRPAEEPTVALDDSGDVLVADGPDLASVTEALSLLRTMVTTGARRVTATACGSTAAAAARLEREVATTYPAFELRGLDWARICARHRERTLAGADLLAGLQRWVAELADVHTAVTGDPPHGALPYVVRVSGERAWFERVPRRSAAAEAGVGPGDELVGLDPSGAWDRTGAPPHARPYLAGRRLLSGPVGVPRTLTARAPDGTARPFTDVPAPPPSRDAAASWQRLASGTAYLRLRGWPAGLATVIDAAFDDLARSDRLLVDLRGNTGGSLVEALAFRDRFLRAAGRMGSVRFSTGDGGLTRSAPIVAEPATAGARWPGRVRFLTDELTCSASEDALLGLQGLDHVEVVGRPSCGGSGRPRTVRLVPGLRLHVSTALTYARDGRCVEGAGIAVDRPLDWRPWRHETLVGSAAATDRGW